MNKSLLIASALGAVLLAACGPKEVPPEPAKTVSYYVAHATERRTKWDWCADDAARQTQDDCKNADRASTQAMLSPTTPTVESTFVAKQPTRK